MNREIITSKQNQTLSHVRKLLRSRSYRESCREYCGEGTKLLEEAVRWHAGVKLVILTADVPCPDLAPDVRILEVPQDLLRQISTQEQPQGALFVCDMPQERNFSTAGNCLILDGIQDPGNLGTIIRTADALQIPLILTDGCADAYNPKTVRAAMGALFRSPPQKKTRDQVIRQCMQLDIPLMATAMNEQACDIRQIDLSGAAVIIGSEGQGVCEEFLEAARTSVIIPMDSRCESLNAAIAAAIVMWQMKQ